MDAIYRLDDGRYIDLDKIICITPPSEPLLHILLQFQLSEKFVYVFPSYEEGLYPDRKEYLILGMQVFDNLINVWKEYKQSKQI